MKKTNLYVRPHVIFPRMTKVSYWSSTLLYKLWDYCNIRSHSPTITLNLH